MGQYYLEYRPWSASFAVSNSDWQKYKTGYQKEGRGLKTKGLVNRDLETKRAKKNLTFYRISSGISLRDQQYPQTFSYQ